MATIPIRSARVSLFSYDLNTVTGKISNVQTNAVSSGGGSDSKPLRVRAKRPPKKPYPKVNWKALSEDQIRVMKARWAKEKKRKRVRLTGWRFPKAYYRTVVVHATVVGTMSFPVGGPDRRFMEGNLTGQIGGNAPSIDDFPDTLALANDRNKVIVKALLKLKDQKINLGVAFAERARTADLVGSAASRIARAYGYAKRRKFKRAADELGVSTRKQQPNNWLELQYGWKPLLNDVYGAVEALSTADEIGFNVSVKAATRNLSESHRVTKGTFSSLKRLQGEWGHFARLDYLPGSGFMRVLSHTGVSNPLEVLWEVVPYSFVVDWFIPVGNYLSALDASNGFEFKSGSITYRRRHTLNIQTGSPPGAVSSNFKGRAFAFHMERSVLTKSPLPWAPSVQNPFSMTRMANGLSLLASAFGRR